MQVVAAVPTRPEPELVEGFVKGRVSIIMPTYNEESCIAESILDVARQFEFDCPDLEIIVVDDGSTDDTRHVIQSVTGGRIRMASYDKNLGKGHAIKVGFLMATGEYSFLVDSDSEIEAIELRSYVKVLKYADIAIGSKRHPLSIVKTPILRKVLSIGYNTLEQILTGAKVSDTQAGFKAGKSAVFYKILPLLSVKRYAFDAELLAVASLLNFRVEELPVKIRLEANFSVKQVIRMMIDLMGICYRMRVRKWYQRNMRTMGRTYHPIVKW